MSSADLKACSLPWCRKVAPGLTLQNFPNDRTRQLLWLDALEMGEWIGIPSENIRSSYSICLQHFELNGKIKQKSTTMRDSLSNSSLSMGVPQISSKIRQSATTVATNLNPRKKNNKSSIKMTLPIPTIQTLPHNITVDVTPGPKTRGTLTLGRKIEVIRSLESGIKQADVCRTMQLPKSTVGSIWASREKIEEAFMNSGPLRKKMRKSRYEEVDTALFKWYTSVTSQNVAVTGRLLQTMAENFAQDLGYEEFTCSSGWLDRFKQRYCIKFTSQKPTCELIKNEGGNGIVETDSNNGINNSETKIISNSVRNRLQCRPKNSAVLATDWIKYSWPKALKMKESDEEYSAEDIFSAEETGILYRITPEEAWKMAKNQVGPDFNIGEERITVMVCANSDGSEKKRLLVIGRQKNPQSFSLVSNTGVGASHFNGENIKFSNLPVDYDSKTDSSSWITEEAFASWLIAWDKKLKEEDREILLAVDSCPVHSTVPKLSNIKVVHIPSNATSVLQPMQQGIITELKLRYRRLMLERLIFYCEQHKLPSINLFDAVMMLNTAWHEINHEDIAASFRLTGLIPRNYYDADKSNSECQEDIIRQTFDQIHCTALLEKAERVGVAIPKDLKFTDFAGIDDCLFAVDYPTGEDIMASCSYEEETSQNNSNQTMHNTSGRGASSDTNTNETITCDPAAFGFLAALDLEPSLNNLEQSHIQPISNLSTSDIQLYLDTLKVWTMSRENCPQEVHNALSTLESFIYNH